MKKNPDFDEKFRSWFISSFFFLCRIWLQYHCGVILTWFRFSKIEIDASKFKCTWKKSIEKLFLCKILTSRRSEHPHCLKHGLSSMHLCTNLFVHKAAALESVKNLNFRLGSQTKVHNIDHWSKMHLRR